jgi:hypothetical protein
MRAPFNMLAMLLFEYSMFAALVFMRWRAGFSAALVAPSLSRFLQKLLT